MPSPAGEHLSINLASNSHDKLTHKSDCRRNLAIVASIMVGVIRRMRSLHARLVDIRLGTGALILPKEIKRLHLRFAIGLQGHLGSR